MDSTTISASTSLASDRYVFCGATPSSSVAPGDKTTDSDLDLLVVVDALDPTERRALMREVRGAIRTFVPVDIVIADLAEVEADCDEVGSAVY